MAKKQAKLYTVTQVNTLVKAALEEGVPARLSMTGEISGWKEHGSGHCYFALKDDKSQLSCVMWRSNFTKCKFEPENGMSVVARGHVDLYPPQGKLQFYVDKLDPAGLGLLQAEFEKMVAKLKAEGLFEDRHKKILPRFPGKIGIITSDSGAAVGDITDSILNRWSAVELVLFAVPVQGEQSSEKIAEMIKKVNKDNCRYGLDLLIVGRGGGSMEDLWAFNEESVARAIFESFIPVISAVGHEYDMTIADLVADARASTPTKAGVIAVPDKNSIHAELSQFESRMKNLISRNIDLAFANLRSIEASRIFRNPLTVIEIPAQKVDELAASLESEISMVLERGKFEIEEFSDKLKSLDPKLRLKDNLIRLNQLYSRIQALEGKVYDSKTRKFERLEADLNAVVNNRVEKVSAKFDRLFDRLKSINPKSVLKRGYSITIDSYSGKVIKSCSDVRSGDKICTEVADNSKISSTVD